MLAKSVKATSKESDSNNRRFVSDSLVDQHLKSHKYAKSLNSRDNLFVAYIISKGSPTRGRDISGYETRLTNWELQNGSLLTYALTGECLFYQQLAKLH